MAKFKVKYMAKDTAKHYPPAYYRYREKHPTVSIVLSKETKDALDQARGEMTYAVFLRSLFTPDGVFSKFQKQRISLEKEKKRLAKVERFLIPCPECGIIMEFNNSDPNWSSEIKPKLQKMFELYIHGGDCGK